MDGLRWLVTADPRPRRRTVIAAALAEVISGGVMVVFGLTDVFALEPLGARSWLIAWGVLTAASAIALYVQVGLARVTSVILSVPAGVLALIFLTLGADGGGPLWVLVGLGLLVVSTPVVLYGVGQLGRVLAWLFSS